MSPSPQLLERLRQLERAARPLEPGTTRRRRLRTAVLASAERFLRSIADRPAFRVTDNPGAGLLDVPIGERGIGLEAAVELFEREVVEPGLNPASPGHLAYIPGGGLYHSALGDYLAAVSDKYAGIFYAGPGAVRMENQLVRWTADLVGYPPEAAGHIASGGSLANLAALATARDAHGLAGADYARAAVYLTSQAHHSVAKALRLIGMAEAPVRVIATDERYRMRPDALAQTIAEDQAGGIRPWLVVAAAGTTDVGAVDPLGPIAEVAHQAGCWYHVDAAYGGFFLLTEHGQRLLRGIEQSDSVILDPHKGLFLPYGSGIVLVRDGALLARTHQYSGHYMQDAVRDLNEVSPADLSPELSKHFRGVRMWLPLITLGTAPFRAALEEKLLLARYFRDQIAEAGFQVGPAPHLSIVTFRWAPAGAGEEEVERVNRAIVDGVRRDGRVFISSTLLNGCYTLRLAIVSFRTHRRTIDLAVKVLRQEAERLSR